MSLQGFSKLNRDQRLERLESLGILNPSQIKLLNSDQSVLLECADHFIENAIGCFQLPLGITCLHIDGRDVFIPMAVEETSIIAGLGKMAHWIRHRGELTTETKGTALLGQVQFPKVKDREAFTLTFEKNKESLIKQINQSTLASFVKRGGGLEKLTLRHLERPDGGDMMVVHLHIHCLDAMGANRISQAAEMLKTSLSVITGEQALLAIVSNLSDTRLSCAKLVLKEVDQDLGKAIAEASLFAKLDPYRAATDNKGVMNGIDPVVIATGNDWRAVEAAVHAYAGQLNHSHQYGPICEWTYQKGMLCGELTAPIPVGTVGGVTSAHPTAKLCLDILAVQQADHLARIIAAVGLVQNLAALHALTGEGIVAGHMKLHINNLLMTAHVEEKDRERVRQMLEKKLKESGSISLSDI